MFGTNILHAGKETSELNSWNVQEDHLCKITCAMFGTNILPTKMSHTPTFLQRKLEK